MARKDYSTIIVLNSIKKDLDMIRDAKKFKSYTQTLIYILTKKGVIK